MFSMSVLPDVHFWVGKGNPGPEGFRVADETGGENPLVKSDKKTMVLTLPGDLTIFDIGKSNHSKLKCEVMAGQCEVVRW